MQINAVTKLNAYLLPRANEAMDRLAGSTFFSTLDLASGYWQLKLNEFGRPKLLIEFLERVIFSYGHLLWSQKYSLVIQSLMQIVLQHLQHVKCLVYLDELLVSSKAKLLKRNAFLRFRQTHLKLKPSKSRLLRGEVVFLGPLVSQHGVTCNLARVEVIRTWLQPKNKTLVCQSVDLINLKKLLPQYEYVLC